MKLSFITYPLLMALLSGLFFLYTPDTGSRLPFYYSPEGFVPPITSSTSKKFSRVYTINRSSTLLFSPVFKSKESIHVTTNASTVSIKPILNDPLKILYDLKIIVFFAFINLLTAIWIYQASRDLLLGALCLVQTVFSFSSYTLLVSHDLQLLWVLSSTAMAFTLFNVALRTTGKETPAYLLVSEIILCLFFVLIAYVGSTNTATLYNLSIINLFLFLIALVITLFLQIHNLWRKTEDAVEKYKRKVLLFGTTAGIALPLLLFMIAHVLNLIFLPIDIILLPGVIFPLTLIYSNYRLHFIKFQLVLTHSLIAGVLTILLVGIYGIVLLLHSILLPENKENYGWIVNIIFILILVFFLDPARRYLAKLTEKRLYRLDSKLIDSLKKLTEILRHHSRIQPSIETYLHEIQKTLSLEKISFLFSGEAFPDLNIKSGRLLRIPSDNKMWKYLLPGQLRVSSYLSYAAGGRGDLFRFLFKNDYLLGLGIVGEKGYLLTTTHMPSKVNLGLTQDQQLRASLLVGHKKNKRKLKLNEIRYLQEAAKLAGLLIYNYALLIQEIAKRRRIRELNLAGLIQRSLPGPAAEEFPHIQMSYINKPATSVTGDYLDIIKLSPEKFAFMIGDVSGHGLGTGYIVSASRSIIRSHLKAGVPLPEIVNSLNSFLVDRYQGGEFITLFIGILNARSGHLEFINAAHPAPFIRKADGSFQELQSTQRLIGVLPTIYHSDVEMLNIKDRIFLFSDGVTETFNREEIAFGDKRLQELLKRVGGDNIADIVKVVDEELNQFRLDAPVTDDITFVAFEFTPQISLLQNILTAIGIGKRAVPTISQQTEDTL